MKNRALSIFIALLLIAGGILLFNINTKAPTDTEIGGATGL